MSFVSSFVVVISCLIVVYDVYRSLSSIISCLIVVYYWLFVISCAAVPFVAIGFRDLLLLAGLPDGLGLIFSYVR